MTVLECKKILSGLKDGDALPVRVRFPDAVGALQTADVEIIEEVTHSPEPKRELIFCAKS